MSQKRSSFLVGIRGPSIILGLIPTLQCTSLVPSELTGTKGVGLGFFSPSLSPYSFSQQTPGCLERAQVGYAQKLGARGGAWGMRTPGLLSAQWRPKLVGQMQTELIETWCVVSLFLLAID